MPKSQNGEAIRMPEIDVENQDNSNNNEDRKSDKLLFGVDDNPPLLTCLTLAAQVSQ